MISKGIDSMCGFVVRIGDISCYQDGLIEKMLDSIGHRGPDNRAVWLNNNIQMGHARLSILDISSDANQPMSSKCDRYVIVFNGEIYNHLEVRKSLSSRLKFKSTSGDTETLVEAISEIGLHETLKLLNGIFSFVVFDKMEAKAYLVRDHFGVKPLYLFSDETGYYIASELKAFYQVKSFKPTLNLNYLPCQLSYRGVPSPNTLINEVSKIEPGQIKAVCTKTNLVSEQYYWTELCTSSTKSKSGRYEVDEAAALVEKELYEGFEENLLSDVEIGLFLSGGLDSSAIAHFASERLNAYVPLSFTASFKDDASIDESIDAFNTASRLKFNHFEVALTQEKFIERLDEATMIIEEPCSAPVSVPILLLAEEAKKAGLKVILSGEGSDEIFAGYPKWRTLLKINHILDKTPKSVVALLLKLETLQFISKTSGWKNFFELLRRYKVSGQVFWGGGVDFTMSEVAEIMQLPLGTVTENLRDNVFDQQVAKLSRRGIAYNENTFPILYDTFFRLPDILLNRLDKILMFNSIEGRVPFINRRLLEIFLRSTSSFQKHWRSSPKVVLRRILASKFDFKLAEKKKGFRVPLQSYRGDLFSQRAKSAIITFNERTAMFSTTALSEIVFKPQDRRLLMIYSFVIWYCMFIKNELPEFVKRSYV